MFRFCSARDGNASLVNPNATCSGVELLKTDKKLATKDVDGDITCCLEAGFSKGEKFDSKSREAHVFLELQLSYQDRVSAITARVQVEANTRLSR